MLTMKLNAMMISILYPERPSVPGIVESSPCDFRT
jgi:hypothetical protein